MSADGVDFDVCILGGGPAGAGMAAYLAKAGVKCVVFERELFPRPHVGESLVPSSTRVFRDLDFLPQMEEARFPHKYGAVWTASDESRPYSHDWDRLDAADLATIEFSEREQPGVGMDYTYHVDRGKFDLMLLQHAHKLGATVYEGVRVRGVDFSGSHPEVRFSMGAREHGVSCRVVVDASGRQTLLGNQLKLKVSDPVFNQFAVHSWFDNYDRHSVSRDTKHFGDYIFVHFMPISNTWIWQIPITETITSIGVVTQRQNFLKGKGDRESFFWEMVANRPLIAEALRKSDRVKPFKDEGDYSYAMSQITGDNWLMIGDAARFVDPIFSTGVSIALNSARFAHADVLAALESGDTSRGSYSKFEKTIRRGTQNWYDFITVYYRLNVLFTYFIRDPRYRLDVLKLLQGDVYDEGTPEVLTTMRTMVGEVEQDTKHPWHQLLGNLTSNAFRPEF
ncbi:MAG TPA: NAD(P)/FAD-dependent oxidoreductase [Kofleriaceae bacterium]|nr:NAD(P)/FAD-dependent oxidoreductase [Kofleriaceae bacterium]